MIMSILAIIGLYEFPTSFSNDDTNKSGIKLQLNIFAIIILCMAIVEEEVKGSQFISTKLSDTSKIFSCLLLTFLLYLP